MIADNELLLILPENSPFKSTINWFKVLEKFDLNSKSDEGNTIKFEFGSKEEAVTAYISLNGLPFSGELLTFQPLTGVNSCFSVIDCSKF
jgi:hypothetical protein